MKHQLKCVWKYAYHCIPVHACTHLCENWAWVSVPVFQALRMWSECCSPSFRGQWTSPTPLPRRPASSSSPSLWSSGVRVSRPQTWCLHTAGPWGTWHHSQFKRIVTYVIFLSIERPSPSEVCHFDRWQVRQVAAIQSFSNQCVLFKLTSLGVNTTS